MVAGTQRAVPRRPKASARPGSLLGVPLVGAQEPGESRGRQRAPLLRHCVVEAAPAASGGALPV
eukprot:3996341-Lingulodinium_polyedra.AAC.1